MRFEIRYWIMMVFLALVSCETDDVDEPDENQNTGTQLTEIALMGANGKAWSSVEGSLEYYSATSTLDSTVNLPFDRSEEPPTTWFGDNRGVADLNHVYYTAPPITQLIPEFGTWELDQKKQTITFVCHNRGADCFTMSKLDGTWAIVSYTDRGGELLMLEKTEDLANQRKLKKKMTLGKLAAPTEF